MSKTSTFVSVINAIRLSENGSTDVPFTIESSHELILLGDDIPVFHFGCSNCELLFSFDRELGKVRIDVYGEKHN